MAYTKDLIDIILSGFRYTGSVINHPTFQNAFHDFEALNRDRMPFHYIERGECVISTANNDYHLKEGDFIAILRPTHHHTLKSAHAQIPQTTTLICGYFEFLAIYNKPFLDSLPDVIVIKKEHMSESRRLAMVMQMLVQEVNSKEYGANVAAKSLTELLFTLILRYVLNSSFVDRGLIAGLAHPHLSKSLAVFHKDFSSPWTVKQLAHAAGLSRSKFIACFNHIIGQSPGTYMTQWRMIWAANQLAQSDRSIFDIALSAGYQSDAAFSRAFKQFYDLAPSAYRKAAINVAY
ncbi:AraC family transcriptional regulator [Pseudoalteromonas luteoviolacea]|uniref:AraC family transcriptional regulator n=1 Tax=Pseudoalteromonas luteoviolacea TaxID=43657 RepID=UPI001B39CD2E|nr:AraC family transcriptional regulator [Pseudoalteromonas luteoviolacea]MBQ4836685.1 AraC family transcriptional regulator [Pseudoalteromonas luteoviolacea]